MRVPEQIYASLFELNPDGVKVLEELCNIYYDRPSYARGDTVHTAFNEGAKSVLHFILNKIAKSKQKGEEIDE